jgi:hypothetical protein
MTHRSLQVRQRSHPTRYFSRGALLRPGTYAGGCSSPANAALRQIGLSRGPQQSARLLLPSAWLVWSFGGRCDSAAGSKAISGDLGRRRGRLLHGANERIARMHSLRARRQACVTKLFGSELTSFC